MNLTTFTARSGGRRIIYDAKGKIAMTVHSNLPISLKITRQLQEPSSYCLLPSLAGHGGIKYETLCSDAYSAYGYYSVDDDTIIEFESENNSPPEKYFFEFGVMLNGEIGLPPAGIDSEISYIHKGEIGLFWGGSGSHFLSHRKGVNTEYLVFRVSFKFVRDLLNQWNRNAIWDWVERLINVPGKHFLILPDIHSVTLAARQYISAKDDAGFAQFYRYSKFLEIFTLIFSKAYHFNSSMHENQSLLEADVKRIRQAAAFIRENLDRPFSTVKLARAVGINDYKLKIGFRKIYGTSIHEYLTRYRLEEAKNLIATGDYSVSEAAMAVGYFHLGRFSGSFKKQFGVLPSQYMSATRYGGVCKNKIAL